MNEYLGTIYIIQEGTLKVEGVNLRITEANEITLKGYIPLEGFKNHGIIVGDFNGLGKATFIDCHCRSSSSGHNGRIIELRSACMLKGEHFISFDKLKFGKAQLDVPYLRRWLHEKRFESTHTTEETTFKLHGDKIVSFPINDNLTISFLFFWHTSMDGRQIVLTTVSRIVLDSHEEYLPIIQIIDLLNNLKKLMNLLCDEHLESENLYLEGGFANSVAAYFPKEIPKQKLLFGQYGIRYDQVETQIGTIMKNWLQTDDIRAVSELLLARVYNEGLNKENTFLNSCFAIEMLHRKFFDEKPYEKEDFKAFTKTILDSISNRDLKDFIGTKLSYANEQTFRSRLKSFGQDFNDILPTEINSEDYIGRIVNTRNYFVHGSKSSKTFEGMDVYHASKQIDVVTKCVLFRLLGVSEDTVDHFKKNAKVTLEQVFKLSNSLSDSTINSLI